MTTWTALTILPERARAEALSDALERLDPEPIGVGSFEIEDASGRWEVGAYFTDKPDAAGLALLETLFSTAPFVISEVPDVDWVAKVKRALTPVEAGRYYVYGSHDADAVPDGRIALLIEAAMAFGTGHHGTTQGCLLALDTLVDDGFEPARVVDVGCGTAVLAMAAARTWDAAEVLASDIDAVAVDVAEANVAANGLVERVQCVEAAGFTAPSLRDGAPFDLVFANILKGPLIDLAPEMARRIAPGGFAILSGILDNQAEDVTRVYSQVGFNLTRNSRIVDWTTLTLRRSV
jgi:ribosomal protein L11 methyltransferase